MNGHLLMAEGRAFVTAEDAMSSPIPHALSADRGQVEQIATSPPSMLVSS